MRFNSKIVAIFAGILMLLAATVSADVPQLITYQGVLTDSVGTPYDGTKDVRFHIYDASATSIWNSGTLVVNFDNGIFLVSLGASPQPALPSAAFSSDTSLTLGITVDPDPEISPRTRFTTVGFSFQSQNAQYADSAGYADTSGFSVLSLVAEFAILADSANYADNAGLLDGVNSTGFAPSGHNHGWEDVGSIVRTVDVSDKVRIGTTGGLLPSATFKVLNTGSGLFDVAVFGINSDSSGGIGFGGLFYKGPNSFIWTVASALGASSYYTGGTAFQTYSRGAATGIYAGHQFNDGIAIHAVATTGNATAIRAEVLNGFSGFYTGGKGLYVKADSLYGGEFTTDRLSTSAAAVYGHFDGTGTVDGKGVLGYSVPKEWYGIGGDFQGGYRGVVGRVLSDSSNAYYGVTGNVSGIGGGSRYGVIGTASGQSGFKFGVYGFAGGAGTNYGVYSVGNCHVSGTLTKSAGAFRIDHPLDPENKYLQHSFVESDEMKNVYDGVVVLDANGSATVTLPDWFEALNENFRYQLTCIGGYSPVYIESEVNNNSFTIAGGTAGMKISWQLTGVRKDAYALANPILLEVPKDAEDIGLYSHPEVYGKPKELGIDYVRQNKHLDEHPEKKAALESRLNSAPAKQGKLKPLPIPEAIQIDAISNN